MNTRRLFFIFSFFLLPFTSIYSQSPAWVEKSNQNAMILLEIMADFNPETAAYFGIEGIDEKILDVKPGFVERERQADLAAREKLTDVLKTEQVPEVRQDLQILIRAIDESVENTRLNQKYFLPYYNVSQLIFYSLQSLLDDQIAADRRPAALVRLNKYTGLTSGYTAVTELLKNHILEKLADEALLGPVKAEIEKDLENTTFYVNGIKELFEKFNMDGYQEAYALLSEQLKDYDAFLQENVIPRAREDFKLPSEIYRDNLKSFGVDMPVDELVRRAKVSFKSLQNELSSLAIMIADKRGWNIKGYREVLKNLKKEQILG